MMRKGFKLIAIFCIMLLLFGFGAMTYVTEASDFDSSSWIKKFDGSTNAKADTTNLATFGDKVLGIIRVVGVAVSIIILLVLGIKYMMGSAEEKAEYKKTMIPYLIGAILLFAGTWVVTLMYDLSKSIGDTSGKGDK